MPESHAADNLPTGLWTNQKISDVFSVTKWFVALNQKWIMIAFAVVLAASVLGMILWLFEVARNGKNGGDDDDGFDYREI